MTHAFRDRSRTHQVLLVLAGALVLALLVAEGLNTGYLPTAVAVVISGGLCVGALFVPPARFPLVAGCAVAASLALSVAEMQMTQRPENTPGVTEWCALLLLIARTVRLQSLLRIIVLVPPTSVAAALLFLRLPESAYERLKIYGPPVLLFSGVLMIVLGLYLRLVDTLRDRERKAAEQAARQAERLEHARELHDFVAHHVTAIVTQAKAARYVTSAGQAPAPADLDGMFAGIEEAGSQAMDSMRSMVSVLRDPEGPAATRPGGDLTQVRGLVETFSAAGRPVRLTLDPRLTERSFPPEISTTVHRLVQESLTNIRKHADTAAHVTVAIRLRAGDTGRLDVTVIDDGRAASRTLNRTRTEVSAHLSAGQHGGYGLVGLAERVEALGGHFAAGPRTGCPGWEVIADIPLPSSPPANRT
ncbi:histidine kinase [Streptomyces sp. RS10V-4]|uniref:sensor histidine kinase n=1 Tax=Streptomyces rhizoryzae TaxID=2932493 RepID=UPI0020043229|nr:histidine kinase [Streptomyces rhizoryzae]MCK7621846.1 histidine kinase [Streptomyces rhizoryzae]